MVVKLNFNDGSVPLRWDFATMNECLQQLDLLRKLYPLTSVSIRERSIICATNSRLSRIENSLSN